MRLAEVADELKLRELTPQIACDAELTVAMRPTSSRCARLAPLAGC
jgi:hypothetical protein